MCRIGKVARNVTAEVESGQIMKSHVDHDEDLYSISNEAHQRILRDLLRLAFYLEISL